MAPPAAPRAAARHVCAAAHAGSRVPSRPVRPAPAARSRTKRGRAPRSPNQRHPPPSCAVTDAATLPWRVGVPCVRGGWTGPPWTVGRPSGSKDGHLRGVSLPEQAPCMPERRRLVPSARSGSASMGRGARDGRLEKLHPPHWQFFCGPNCQYIDLRRKDNLAVSSTGEPGRPRTGLIPENSHWSACTAGWRS